LAGKNPGNNEVPTMSDVFPPTAPEGELDPHYDSSFVARCLELITKGHEQDEWLFGTPVVTRSKIWGRMLHVDLIKRPLSANRAVCWSNGSEISGVMFVGGQNLAKLGQK
jgi:hypothetical protein